MQHNKPDNFSQYTGLLILFSTHLQFLNLELPGGVQWVNKLTEWFHAWLPLIMAPYLQLKPNHRYFCEEYEFDF